MRPSWRKEVMTALGILACAACTPACEPDGDSPVSGPGDGSTAKDGEQGADSGDETDVTVFADGAVEDATTSPARDAGDGASDTDAVDSGVAPTCTECIPTVLALPSVVSATDARFPGVTWYGLGVPVSLAVDSTSVYWTEIVQDASCLGPAGQCASPSQASRQCVLRRVAKGGGLPATFDPLQNSWIPVARFNPGGPLGVGAGP